MPLAHDPPQRPHLEVITGMLMPSMRALGDAQEEKAACLDIIGDKVIAMTGLARQLMEDASVSTTGAGAFLMDLAEQSMGQVTRLSAIHTAERAHQVLVLAPVRVRRGPKDGAA